MNMNSRKQGQILIQALLVSALAAVVITAIVNLAVYNIGFVKRTYDSEQALQIAEAGIEYYRWHLAHSPGDYMNGTGQPGPYTIDYADKSGTVIGQYVLDIIPPAVGSTAVTIRSTGKLNANPLAVRKIEVKLAIPSFANYAIVANDVMRFGQGTTVSGLIHSNDGIRFDGVANNLVTSAKPNYDDPDHTGGNEFGVHTHVYPPPQNGVNPNFVVAEAPPTAPVPNRPDVFMVGRQFPVPAVDFTGLSATLAQMKAAGQNGGLYFGPSGALGYEMALKTDNTFSLAKVTSLKTPPSNCTNSANEAGWGTWSVNATTTIGTYPIPGNGIVFFEDNLWASGKINNSRVTVASGKFPQNSTTDTSITVNNDLLYTNYGGEDVIALIAQNNVNIGLWSGNNMRIDAALMAQNSRAGRYYYSSSNCGSTALRNSLTLYGSITTNKRYGFSWSCSGVYCSGYATRNIVYDLNLLSSQPPNYPTISNQYQIVSWQELK